MTHSTARLFSIVGHPAVLMPIAALVASSPTNAFFATGVAAGVAVLVMIYSFYKTMRGDWSHIDASLVEERAQLNARLGIALFAVTAALLLLKVHVAIVSAVFLSATVLVTAHSLRRWGKLSLHQAFAVFAALIVWPYYQATAVLFVVAVAVGWSRLVLRRHAVRDLAWGFVVGALAGLVFQSVRLTFDA
jgi:membrane-associated phospholipid phosphatase